MSGCGRYIYHIALIDYLQAYDLNKKLERAFKTVKLILPGALESEFGRDNLSVINSTRYRTRFLDFMKNKVLRNVA